MSDKPNVKILGQGPELSPEEALAGTVDHAQRMANILETGKRRAQKTAEQLRELKQVMTEAMAEKPAISRVRPRESVVVEYPCPECGEPLKTGEAETTNYGNGVAFTGVCPQCPKAFQMQFFWDAGRIIIRMARIPDKLLEFAISEASQ